MTTVEITPEIAVKLAALREPFPDTHVAYRPQPTCKACTDSQYKNCERHNKIRCTKCKQWVTEAHIDLAYVGHAEATDRLLASDPTWTWKPMHRDIDPQVLAAAVASGNPEIVQLVLDNAPPKFDQHGGLWIWLTVHGVTRPGYGDAVGKRPGPMANKEVIGDAIRNASMRFGLGLDLWSKSDMGEQEVAAALAAAEQDRAAEQPQVQRPTPVPARSPAPAAVASPVAQQSAPQQQVPAPGPLPVPALEDLDGWKRYIVAAGARVGFAQPDGTPNVPALAIAYEAWSGGALLRDATTALLQRFAEHLKTIGRQKAVAA